MSPRAAAAVAALAVFAAPAEAAAEVTIRGVDTTAYPRITLTVVASEPSTAKPRVAEGGRRARGVAAANLGAAKSVVVLIDRSRSMRGGALVDAAAAARGFLAGKPPSDRVAVVAFGSSATQLTRFATSTVDADAALRALSVDEREGTALYDAVRLAARAFEGEPPSGRVVVLLTDGRDVGSATTLREAVQAARGADAIVYAIGIEGGNFSPAPLRTIARATGGRYLAADATEELPGAYARIGEELRRTWRIEYVTSARPGERPLVRIWLPGLGEATTRAKLPGAPAAGPRPDGRPVGAWADVLLALAVAALVVGTANRLTAYRRIRRLRERLAPARRRPGDDAAPRRSVRERIAASAAGLFEATERSFGRAGQWRALERLLAQADLPLRAVEVVYAMLAAGFALAFVAALAGAPAIVIAAFLVIGAGLPHAFVRVKARRRLAAFEAQLPSLLMTLASSLKSGHSFREGLRTIAEEGREPARKELRRVLSEARLGRPVEEALADMAERVGSKDFEFVVSAVTIQRQVGGSLAGIFDMVADAVRGRQQFAQRVRALTAQGRLSAYVLVALPIGLGLLLTVVNGDYMSPLYTTGLGRALLLAAAVMMAFGTLILRRIVSYRG